MSRTNRPRRRNTPIREEDEKDSNGLDSLRAGWRRTEMRRGMEFNVQPVSAMQAAKVYTCPGCGAQIEAGVAHVVVWRADGVLGDEADIAGRRHWHARCWRIG